MDISQIKDIIELAKHHGVSYIKVGELEVSLFDVKPSIPSSELAPKNEEISDEDMLFYSVLEPKDK